MKMGRIILALATVVTFCVTLLLAPVVFSAGAAIDGAPQADCFAPLSSSESLASVVADPTRWNCDMEQVSLQGDGTAIRIPLAKGEKLPRYFISLLVFPSDMHIGLQHGDQLIAVHRYTPADLIPTKLGNNFRVPLPRAQGPVDAVIVAFDKPVSTALFLNARLADTDPIHQPGAARSLLLIAIVCGLLAMPIAYNVAFYPVLRERFVIWHCVLSLSLLAHCLLTSGIAAQLFDLSADFLVKGIVLSFGSSVAAMCIFTEAFIEPGKLHPALRKAMHWMAVWLVVITLVHMLFPLWLRPIQIKLYYAAFIPVLALLMLTIFDGLRHGSRAAAFKLVGLTPFFAMGSIRLVTMLAPGVAPRQAMAMLYAAIVIEGVATALGVADRFMKIKRQRDDAIAETRLFEDLADRDPLTGLLNRRAIERSFDDLREQGFHVCALIDLDHFKAINDTFGHAKGDEVLRAVSTALADNEDTVAVRMGGEEFMLVLRGADARERAEALRQAITRQTFSAVSELNWPVTASMGVVELPERSAEGITFAALYARADRLLYDAKAGGRNRTIGEKMTLFSPRGKDRRLFRRQAA